MEFVAGFFDYAAEFVLTSGLLLVSGCVSLVAVVGFACGLGLLVVKHLEYFAGKREEQTEESENQVDSSCSLCQSDYTELTLRSSLQCYSCNKIHCLKCSFGGVCSACCSKSDDLLFAENFNNIKEELLQDTTASHSLNSSYHKDGEVREFLERLIETLVGENLDDIPLTPLSTDAQYESIVSSYHQKLSEVLKSLSRSLYVNEDGNVNDSEKPSIIYVGLKSVVREITDVASTFSPLQNYENDNGPLSIECHLEGQTYEDILATAIINKIISRYQNGNILSNNASCSNNDSEFKCSNSWNSSPSETLSLMVEEHVEEITTKYLSSDEDEKSEKLEKCLSTMDLSNSHRAPFPELGKDVVDGYDSSEDDDDTGIEVISNVDSWEDNWLFQKKKTVKMKDRSAQVSVPMLVPNPSADYRALIGDVDVDETSDLSECSDSILEDLIESSTANNNAITYLYNFKDSLSIMSEKSRPDSDFWSHKGSDHSGDLDSSGVTSISRDLSDAHSLSSSPCHSEEGNSWTGINETRNRNLFLSLDDSGEGSLDAQQDAESSQDEQIIERHVLESECHMKEIENNNFESSPEDDLTSPPKPGTIAEREHLKWQKAAPLENNPYSKENIEKRNLERLLLKNTTGTINSPDDDDEHSIQINCGLISPDVQRYGRDYYINTEGSLESTTNQTKAHEKNIENGGTPTSNGIPKNANLAEESNKKNSNLVRVLSWSDRKDPDVEIRKRLPSVKELAKQFSVQTEFHEVKKNNVGSKNHMVHSLTARSMPRQFREGLKNNNNKSFNRNVVTNEENERDDFNDQVDSCQLKTKIDSTITFWENM